LLTGIYGHTRILKLSCGFFPSCFTAYHLYVITASLYGFKNIKPILCGFISYTKYMTLRERVATNIEQLANYTRKSKRKLSKALGLDETAIFSYTSQRTLPSIEVLYKLCILFDCTWDDILGPPPNATPRTKK